MPETPRLSEEFFEIEDVRSKRVHKGHTEYLIKWRDWPERANTWEPVENIQEFVDEFEESLRKRKRKRKVTFHRKSPSKSLSVRDIKTSDHMVEGDRRVPKDFDESTRSTNRSTGARRRKSGKVRKFQNESTLIENVQSGDKSDHDGVEPDGETTTGDAADDPHKVVGFSYDSYPCYITKIVKPIGYKVSIANDVRDVCVTFVAENSDGTEVVVDNKQLKTENPQLLCSFYEKIIYCNPHE
ncbi:hypothetical protein MKX03_020759 [Papaver bracteatum]|nr:hypothetical protein MKX03_020755 [Papaver bracteatum]KAI3851588.1 hypothetical protein MKX03_020759 [Papaver bracteatum]